LKKGSCGSSRNLLKKERIERKKEVKMMMVVIVVELLGEYTAVLTRLTERLLPPRRSLHVHALRNLRLNSTASTQDSSSFLLYF
jgi:hypothetical protein